MIITEELKKNVCDYLECDYTKNNSYPDECYLFYYRCMQNKLHFADADRYAILNTLFNYDIGISNAIKIDSWMDKNGEEIYEFNANNSREILEKATKELHLDIDFSNFITKDFEKYKFFDTVSNTFSKSERDFYDDLRMEQQEQM